MTMLSAPKSFVISPVIYSLIMVNFLVSLSVPLSISIQQPNIPISSPSSTNKATPTSATFANSAPSSLTLSSNTSNKMTTPASTASATTSTSRTVSMNLYPANPVKMDRANQSALTNPISNTSRNMANESSSSLRIMSSDFDVPISINKLVSALPYGISLRNVVSSMASNMLASSSSASEPTLANALTVSGLDAADPATHTVSNHHNSNGGNNNYYPDRNYHKSHVVNSSSSSAKRSHGDTDGVGEANNNKVTNSNDPTSANVVPGHQNRGSDPSRDVDYVDYVESLDEETDADSQDSATQSKQRQMIRTPRNDLGGKPFIERHRAPLSFDLKTASADSSSGYNYPEADSSHHDDLGDDGGTSLDAGYSTTKQHSHHNQHSDKRAYSDHPSTSTWPDSGPFSNIADGQHHGKYFQYSSVSSPDEWNFGYRRGNPHHIIERRDHGKGPSNRWHSKVKWSDEYGAGYGIHVWDYNHGDKK